jgi:hypothetical protein
MRTILFILVAFCLINLAAAQEEKLKKVSFRSINLLGAVTGAQRDAPIIQTINGVAFNTWSTGVGVGIDQYSERSIPLFVDVRKSFGKGFNKAFAYVDGGINFTWLNSLDRESRSFPDYDQPSWYYDAGVGWKIPLGTKTAFLLSAGFTLKQLKGHRTAYGPTIGGRLNEYEEKFENTYRRISVKFGVEL